LTEPLQEKLLGTRRQIKRRVDALAEGVARQSGPLARRIGCGDVRGAENVVSASRGRRSFADIAYRVTCPEILVELRGVELEGNIVSATEDEFLALPSSGRGRR
jgi:hypothetical protein